MKRVFSILVFTFYLLLSSSAIGQNCYWVMLTDKQGTTFDPYTYFDAKAIERYQLNGADLYDISNYPLNAGYVAQVDALATEEVGLSRWFNAVAVMATPEQIEAIQSLPFVKEVVALESNMHLASANLSTLDSQFSSSDSNGLSAQLHRMGGRYFRAKGINGKGVRIAVFDGGFPQVNTHIAFKHLRDNHQIIKTWNFPNKKEDVYGWNSHGLMTLSCIAGIHRYQGTEGEVCTDNGLATGAEFLLARTEVEAEPFKEEVWWQMAMEWADKNGAQIISSSLGYGKDRYYTRDMNGRSYVAKAGNMAARKGILVCNSAGNEGSDQGWRTIITPADADSVLCVGGIDSSMTKYRHISFSSYGPTADGRQKPNVCAFGCAHTARKGAGNDNYDYAYGTSFSCPLVSGFAACALQAHPELTAMQLFHEIEKSADLYPYCDYTFGYGVPQADYFTGDRQPVQPTFRIEKVDSNHHVRVIPLQDNPEKCYVFVKNSRSNGSIIDYRQWELKKGFTTGMWIEICVGDIVTIHYNGYTDTVHFFDDNGNYALGDPDNYLLAYLDGDYDPHKYDLITNPHSNSNYISEKKSDWCIYYSLGVAVPTGDAMKTSFWSPAQRVGYRWVWKFTKAYGWGIGAEYGYDSYRFGTKNVSNDLDKLLDMDAIVENADKRQLHRVNVNQLSLELFQRVRFVPGGSLYHKGYHWDLGAFISYTNNSYRLRYSNNTDLIAESRDLRLSNVYPLRGTRLLYGITTRLTYDWSGIYVRFNLQNLGKELAPDEVALPRLEIGLHILLF